MSFIKIGEGFSPVGMPSKEYLNSLPVVTHVYGVGLPLPTSLYWMTYQSKDHNVKEDSASWSIAFARNIKTQMPEFTKHAVDYLENILSLKISPDYIQFMKTKGSVPAHFDETRNCCVNIGLNNCSSAQTLVGDSQDLEEFKTKRRSYRVEDGSAYLLDVTKIHSVVGDAEDSERLLITVPFLEKWQTIKDKLRQPHRIL